MHINRLQHEFRLRSNKLDSNHKRDLPKAFIDDLLNDAYFYLIEVLYSGNNYKQYKLGFEYTQQRIDMLSPLVVKQPEQLCFGWNTSDLDNNIYEYYLDSDVGNLKYDYLHFLRAYVNTSCGIINVKPEQIDDLNLILNDSVRKPSKKWRRLVASFGKSSHDDVKSSLFVYSNGEIDLNTLCIEYLRCPERLFVGGYDTLEFLSGDTNAPNKTSNPISPELADKYCNLIVDVAVQEFERIMGDPNAFQLRKNKLDTLL